MAEDLLHAAQVRTPLEQMRGHSVAQAVRTEIRRAVDDREGAVDDPADDARVDPPTALTDEQGRARLAGEQGRSRPGEPGLDRPPGRVADRDGALLVPLAEHPNDPPISIEIVEIESAQLRDPDPGRIQQLEHGHIADADRPSGLAGPGDCLGEHGRGIGLLEGRRQGADGPRRLQTGRRILRDQLLLLGPEEEHPDRGGSPLQRGPGTPVRLLVGQPAAQGPQVDRIEPFDLQPTEMAEESLEVTASRRGRCARTSRAGIVRWRS